MQKQNWKRRVRALSLVLGVVVVGTLGVRQAVAQVYVVPLASMEPEIPAGSRILVYKLGDTFAAGDIVVFRDLASGQAHLGRYEGEDAAGLLTLSRNGTGPITVRPETVIGRVVMTTR